MHPTKGVCSEQTLKRPTTNQKVSCDFGGNEKNMAYSDISNMLFMV